jgi:hypothetical protein
MNYLNIYWNHLELSTPVPHFLSLDGNWDCKFMPGVLFGNSGARHGSFFEQRSKYSDECFVTLLISGRLMPMFAFWYVLSS